MPRLHLTLFRCQNYKTRYLHCEPSTEINKMSKQTHLHLSQQTRCCRVWSVDNSFWGGHCNWGAIYYADAICDFEWPINFVDFSVLAMPYEINNAPITIKRSWKAAMDELTQRDERKKIPFPLYPIFLFYCYCYCEQTTLERRLLTRPKTILRN